jgi:hypothetical protein
MGIDIYASWPGQTERERDAQSGLFRITLGKAGYLREAYHGPPYVTKYLVAEAFAGGEAAIPAARLRARLPAAVLLSLYREYKVYGEGDPSVVDSDKLAEVLTNIFEQELNDTSHETIASAFTPRSLETARGLIEDRALAPAQLSFVDFVQLCERKERETGEPCTITASA